MNKLQELRDQFLEKDWVVKDIPPEYNHEESFVWNEAARISYKRGWNALEALKLPVRFAEWKDNVHKDYDTWQKVVDRMKHKKSTPPTAAEFYPYWIDNVYKPEEES